MNVFLRELRAHRKGLIFWSIGMLFLVLSGVAKFYGYSGNGQSSISSMLDLFPKSLQVLFGLEGFDLSRASGVYGILFMYVALMAVIHAVLLGTDLISKEERDKTTEFLFAKPISRTKVVTAKLLAGVVNIVVLNLVTLVSAIYTVAYYSKGSTANSDIVLLGYGLFILQLLFLAVGACVAAVSKRPRIASSLAATALLVSFILYFAINLSGKIDALKYFTPFKYFEARTIIADGSLDPFYVGLSGLLVVIMLITTYVVYRRRDLIT